MKNFQKEQYEYEKFMFELAKKSHEMTREFNKLSKENKYRVECEIKNIFAVNGFANALEHITKQRRYDI